MASAKLPVSALVAPPAAMSVMATSHRWNSVPDK
jgi:hypothetical protein